MHDNVGHLLRLPECVFEGRTLCRQYPNIIVDACHVFLMRRLLCRFEGECWNMESHGANVTQMAGACMADGGLNHAFEFSLVLCHVRFYLFLLFMDSS